MTQMYSHRDYSVVGGLVFLHLFLFFGVRLISGTSVPVHELSSEQPVFLEYYNQNDWGNNAFALDWSTKNARLAVSLNVTRGKVILYANVHEIANSSELRNQELKIAEHLLPQPAWPRVVTQVMRS